MKTLDIKLTKVDQLGFLLAEVSELNERIEALKDEIKNQGEGHYDGNLFRACVSLSQRKVVDNKAVFEQAHVPSEIIEANTKTTASITLKVTSK